MLYFNSTDLDSASVEQVLRHALGHDVEEKSRVAHQLQCQVCLTCGDRVEQRWHVHS